MPPQNSKKLPSSWSTELLSEFHKFINTALPVSFTILEKQKMIVFFGKQISTSFWSRNTSQLSYRGYTSVGGFTIPIVFNVVKNLEEESGYIGYIELVNSSREDNIPVPEVRGFILEDSGIYQTLNEMMLESKIFNIKMSPVYIYLEQAYCLKDKHPEELMKKKIPIRELSTFQKNTCTD